jgi:hypothetical protein
LPEPTLDVDAMDLPDEGVSVSFSVCLGGGEWKDCAPLPPLLFVCMMGEDVVHVCDRYGK